jgi:hypothetical protein
MSWRRADHRFASLDRDDDGPSQRAWRERSISHSPTTPQRDKGRVAESVEFVHGRLAAGGPSLGQTLPALRRRPMLSYLSHQTTQARRNGANAPMAITRKNDVTAVACMRAWHSSATRHPRSHTLIAAAHQRASSCRPNGRLPGGNASSRTYLYYSIELGGFLRLDRDTSRGLRRVATHGP